MQQEAKDIMNSFVVYVKPETPVCTAIELLVSYNVSGIPVVEDDMTLIAIISEKDILKSCTGFADLADKTVYDFMTQPVIFFEENESVMDVWHCLVNNDFRRVPVTSGGKLVGVISRRDIVKQMLKEAHPHATSVAG